jgi:hypothetical protein
MTETTAGPFAPGASVRGKVTHPGYMNAIEQHLAKAGDLWPATPR